MIYESSGNVYTWHITLNGSSPVGPSNPGRKDLKFSEPFITGIQYYTGAATGSDLFVRIRNGGIIIPGGNYNENSQPSNWLPLFGSGWFPVSMQIDPETPVSLEYFVNSAPGTPYYLHFAAVTSKILLHDVIAHELREVPIMFQKLTKNLVTRQG